MTSHSEVIRLTPLPFPIEISDRSETRPDPRITMCKRAHTSDDGRKVLATINTIKKIHTEILSEET